MDILSSIGVHKFEGFEFINSYSSWLVLVSLALIHVASSISLCGLVSCRVVISSSAWMSLVGFEPCFCIQYCSYQLEISRIVECARQELR